MKCYFRTNITHKSGIGNYMRCLRLALKFKQYGYESTIITDKKINFKKNKSIKYKSLYDHGSFNSEKEDAENLLSLIASPGHIFLDDYRFGIKWQKKIKTTNNKLIVITDFFPKKIISDFVINTKPDFLNSEIYNRFQSTCHKNTKVLLGPRYSIVDKKKKISIKEKKKKPSIGFYFGGSGDLNIPLNIIKNLNNNKLMKDYTIYIFVGPYAKNRNKLFKFQNKNLVNIKVIKNSLNISDHFSHLDLLISSAGLSIFECSLYNIITVLFELVDNQKVNQSCLEKLGNYFLLKKNDLSNPKKISKFIITIIENKERIKRLFNKKKIVLDDKGSERIAEEILMNKKIYKKEKKLDENVKNLNKKYKIEKVGDHHINDYLSISNKKVNRKFSLSKNKINKIDHYNWWFNNKRESYIFKKGSKKIILFFHEKINIMKKDFIFPGWYVIDEKINFLEILKGIYYQYKMLSSSKNLNLTQIGVISKKNQSMVKLTKKLNWVLIKKGDKLLNILKNKMKMSKNFYYYKRR